MKCWELLYWSSCSLGRSLTASSEMRTISFMSRLNSSGSLGSSEGASLLKRLLNQLSFRTGSVASG